jgi:pyruvate dehydrogenase E2 component (dihydrolipoamide acetyltransferase)
VFNVKFADIGEGIHEGVLLKLFVDIGQTVEEGENLFTLETDKVNAEIPSPVSGTVKSVQYAVGDRVNVGDTIVVIDDGQPGVRSNMAMNKSEMESTDTNVDKSETGGEKTPKNTEPRFDTGDSVVETVEEKKGASVVGEIEVSSQLIPASEEGAAHATETGVKRKVLATPVARMLAKDLSVDIQRVKGTGPNGRVMKADIRAFADAQQRAAAEVPLPQSAVNTPVANTSKPLPSSDVPVKRVQMSMLRKTVAENMVQSRFTIPHTTMMDEVDVHELVALKREVAELATEEGVKLTYLAFFIKAIVLGLKAFPFMNASVDMANSEVLLKQAYHIGIAVDTPDGLMVPVIKNADQLSIFEIAREIERLSQGARARTLQIAELKDSTFSITNYGSVGSSFGVPIIRYPEAGIMGVGSIQKKPVVIEDEIVIREILPLSLSFDHRIIDGADAGRFVNEVKRLLSNPKKLILM